MTPRTMRTFNKQIKVLIWTNIDLIVFVFIAGWSLVAAIRINRFYQDTWVLEDLWIYIVLLIGTYIIIVNRLSDLKKITILTLILTFLLNALPALKYTYLYSSSVDVAYHVSFSALIAKTGKLPPNQIYSSTPGFHVLSATISQISGLQIETTEKFLPNLLGGLVPLGFYIFCKRSKMPVNLAKWIIVLSSLSLPVVFHLNGTSFSLPIIIYLLTFVMLRIINPGENGIQYTLIAFLFILQILFWHPSSSLIYPIFFITVGVIGLIFSKSTLLPIRLQNFLTMGILAIVSTFTYWMYEAQFVWEHFRNNLALVFETDVSSKLIPPRLFQLSLSDQAIILLLYHARDGIFIFTGILGLLFLVKTKLNEKYILSNKMIASIFVVSLALMIGIFIIDFGKQGYRRFLTYPVVFSPVLAGYGLWKVSEFISKHFRSARNLLFPLFLALFFIISFIQLYPYQNIIPSQMDSSYSRNLSPIVWIHQVNTEYQYQMLNYALNYLKTNDQILTDDIGTHQESFFLELNSVGALRSWLNPRPEAGILLLHWPGMAGAYLESLELRSMDKINYLRTIDHMNTIYDNGYSFILYYPDNIQLLEDK